MKILILVLLITFGIISCNENSNCIPEISRATWTINKTIQVEYDSEIQQNYCSILEGDNRLFEYNHSAAQCENIYDDEWIITVSVTTTPLLADEEPILIEFVEIFKN